MRKSLFAAAAVAGLLAFGSAADAATLIKTYNFGVTDVSGFSGSSFGSMTVAQTAAGLDFSVTLASGYQFRNAPDSNHWDMNFKLDTNGLTIGGLNPSVFTQASGNSFKASPFGSSWNYAVDCASCKPGYKSTNPTTMKFSIAGITFDDLESVSYNSNQIFFVADVVNTKGKTGNIGATFVSSATPEPAAWSLMILGIGGIGGALRIQRRRQAAVA